MADPAQHSLPEVPDEVLRQATAKYEAEDVYPCNEKAMRLALTDALPSLHAAFEEAADHDLTSLRAELATLLGPRKPREGVTQNEQWIAAVGELLGRAETAEEQVAASREQHFREFSEGLLSAEASEAICEARTALWSKVAEAAKPQHRAEAWRDLKAALATLPDAPEEKQDREGSGVGEAAQRRYEKFVEAARMIRGSQGPQSSKVAFEALYAALDAHEAERLATPEHPALPDVREGEAPEENSEVDWPGEIDLVIDVCDPPGTTPSILTDDRREHVAEFASEFETRRYIPAPDPQVEAGCVVDVPSVPDGLLLDVLRTAHRRGHPRLRTGGHPMTRYRKSEGGNG